MIPNEPLTQLITLALEEDLAERGDVTSQATLTVDATLRGKITAKAEGVIAGLDAVAMVYTQLDPQVTVESAVADGAHVEPGMVVCAVNGRGQSVLTGERTALNFLQRLSGIATLTAQFVEAVAGTHATILDTRKTTPGWRLLEKYAVRMGGGQNHRLGLHDMVLIKDNHIDAAGGIAQAVMAARHHLDGDSLPIEVEVKTLDELREALDLPVDRIMLDNMTLDTMRDAVQIADGRVPLEASGNVTLDTVRDIALTGVDFISVGALTHSAPALDLSMRLMTMPERENSTLEVL